MTLQERRQRYVNKNREKVRNSQRDNYQRTRLQRNARRRELQKGRRDTGDKENANPVEDASDQTQPTSISASDATQNQLPNPQQSSHSFLFVPLDKINEIGRLKSLAIPASKDSAKSLPYFDIELIDSLVDRFGDGFAARGETPVLHQGVLLMEVMKFCYKQEVIYMNVDELTRTCRQYGARHMSLGLRPLVIFLYQTTYSMDWVWLNRLFDELTALPHDKPLRTYPCRTELVWEARKLGDIQVLDDIARLAKHKRFQYRPITCSGSGRCALAEHSKTVQKRSSSCGSRHVKINSCRTSSLHCEIEGKLPATKQPTISTAVYFHQEFVDTFDSIGEFRVFLVCERCGQGLRNRRAKIIHTIRTKFEDDDIIAYNVTATESSYHELHEFALYIMSCLRDRYDWEEKFESLEVGVRLDIAISNDERFFVNEITRWYAADWFSLSTLGPPHTQLCSSFATALDAYFSYRNAP